MFEKRGSGVLLPLSSTPSDYGVGVFGGGIYNFLDKISRMGFSYWQVLPFCPVDEYGSPYSAGSAFAGDYIYTDPLWLYERGLVSKADVESNIYKGSPYTANYSFAREHRLSLLHKAYKNIGTKMRDELKAFSEANPWANDYALYMAVKEQSPNGSMPSYSEAKKNGAPYSEDAAFWCFTQYIFEKQWEEIKNYANSRGIAVIGDMPFYVAEDSVDFWAAPHLFDVDETLKPRSLAGVPPDYFSADGQFWGNPLYNWGAMKADGYSWWLGRLGSAFTRFDAVRVDHFRAFASFWQIPVGAKSAKEGKWVKGAGHEFFDLLYKKYPSAAIIAEDLGCGGEDVTELLHYTGIPGMAVMQFAFDPDGDSSYLPHNLNKNTVSYIGTHDNNTILGWLWEADERERQFALDYCGFKGSDWGQGGYRSESCRAVTETVWKSCANTAIIAFQDMCGFGSDARMNTPGTRRANWLFRTTTDTVNSVDSAYFRHINQLYRRSRI